MTEHEPWPVIQDQRPDEGPDDPPKLDLERTDDPVASDDPRLPVEAVEGKLLEADPPRWKREQPQIKVLWSWTNRQDAPAAIAWAAGHYSRLVARHSVRLPLYWLTLFGWSFRGAGRLLSIWWLWANDVGTYQFMRTLNNQDAPQYNALDNRRRLAQRFRFGASGIVAAVLGWTVWWATQNVSLGLLWGLLLLVVIPLLGVRGRPIGKPIMRHFIHTDEQPQVSESLILVALGALGIKGLNDALKEGAEHPIRFTSPVHRDGPGWRADIDLPPGVTATDVIQKRGALASGLRRHVSAVWPESDPDSHEARLVLWVGQNPMAKQKPIAWPLADRGTVDLFEPFPIGTDPRGKPISITLMFALMIIGAMTRMGKTATLRLFLLAAALDPRSELHIYELKGSGDLNSLAAVAHRLVSGDDDEDIAKLLADAKELQATMRRRMKRLKNLPRDICPENKVTPYLASRRELQLHPILLVLDECHLAFEHPTYGSELKAILIDLGRRGAAAGTIVILATQRPDADAIPPKLASNAVLRFCLKVDGQVANDMILGTSAYKNGIRATMFSRKEEGVGWLAGEADDPIITRAAYVDGKAAEKVVARARQIRAAAGLLTGEAAGEEFPEIEAPPSLLANVADVWPDPKARESFEVLARLLADTLPDTYPQCTDAMVSAACRAAGLKVVQVKVRVDGKQINRYGIERQALLDHLDSKAA